MYSHYCELQIDKTITLSDYVKTYEEFIALNAIIEKAKKLIDDAHNLAIISDLN